MLTKNMKQLIISLFLLCFAFGTWAQKNLEFTVKGVSFNMIYVQGGSFTMGCTPVQGRDCRVREKPAHTVTLSTYYIGETEVTQELWKAVMGDNPSYFRSGSLKRPVERVSWEDCQTFIRKLNELTGKKFRLPTEAEWEFAARGGTKSAGYKYSGSNDINAVAWYWDNAGTKEESSPDYGTHVVKTKKPNELGIYDMSGNVREWCSDWYGDYTSATQTNPQGAPSGSDRVCRGGVWRNFDFECRSSCRGGRTPDFRTLDLGLRLVLIP